MNAWFVYPWEDVYTDFRRHIETPSIGSFLKGVENSFQLTVLRAKFEAEIRLEHSFQIHSVAS